MRIGIGSENPAKIEAVRPFIMYFKDAKLVSYSSDSLVSAQPFRMKKQRKVPLTAQKIV